MGTRGFVVISLLLILSLPSLFFLPVHATSIFSDDFESGDFSAWTGTVQTPTIQSVTTYHGTYAARCLCAWPYGYFYKTLTSTYTNIFCRIYLYLTGTLYDGGNAWFIKFMDASNNDLLGAGYQNVGGTLQVTIERDSWDIIASNYTISTGEWHYLELEYDAVGGVQNLWIDGGNVFAWVRARDTAVKTVKVGLLPNTVWDGGLCSLYVDCANVADAYIGPEFSDTTGPTFDPKNPSTTVAGASCTFPCLIDDNLNVSSYIFSTNNTGSWTNDTATAFSSFFNTTAAWANVTKTLNDTVGNVVSYLWYANDTSNNWGSSDQYNLTLTAPYRPNLQMTPDNTTCRKYLETFSVQINVTNAIDTQAFNFTIYYDPLVLNYSSVSWGELGTGTMTEIDTTDGILEGNVADSPITGNHWLLNITFQADRITIWKDGLTNKLEGRIWFQEAQLGFTDNSTLQYVEGGVNRLDVNQMAYTFLPIRGDVNSDGTVDVLDLRTVAFYYDKNAADLEWPEASKYDLKPDNTIDIFDLVIVASNIGFNYP